MNGYAKVTPIDRARRAPIPPNLPSDAAVERLLISSTAAHATTEGAPGEQALSALATVPSAAFFLGEHQLAWEALQALREARTPIDRYTAASAMQTIAPGVARAIGEDVDAMNVTERIEPHARRVMKLSRIRQAMEIGSRLMAEGAKATDDEVLIDRAISELKSLAESSVVDTGTTTRDSLQKLWKSLMESPDPCNRGMSWGWRDCDSHFGLLVPGRMTVLGARPGVGKTNIGWHVAVDVAGSPVDDYGIGDAVFFLSAELQTSQLLQRQVGIRAHIPSWLLESGEGFNRMTQEQRDRLAQEHEAIANLAIHIDDGGGRPMAPGQLEAKVRSVAGRMAAGTYRSERGVVYPRMRLRLVVVDYLQRLKGPLADPRASREQQVAEIAKGLSDMAKTLNVHVLALAQVGREGDDPKRELRMSDLRESGQIEAEAASIVFISRPEEHSLRLRQVKNRFRPLPSDPVMLSVDRGQIGDRKPDAGGYR